MKTVAIHLFLVALFLLSTPCSSQAITNEFNIPWRTEDIHGQTKVHLYFFWSIDCAHCQNAQPFIDSLSTEHDWLEVHSLEITKHPEHLKKFQHLARQLNQEATSVPAFFLCNSMWVGWDHEQGMGHNLRLAAQQCLQQGRVENSLAFAEPDFLASLNVEAMSLPVFTVVIALLDAFNPCAFFILLFLLSLLVHARSRTRMLLVGLTFVIISGLIYFMFMAAWLNLFLLVGSMPMITLIAGCIAVLIGLLNSREFFLQKSAISLSIPRQAKPGLFKRMGALIATDRLPLLLLGTVTLAIAVNGYELLCTAGFPMVYTRTLTLQQFDTTTYYIYLALYNLIYILPLIIIVAIFTFTLGRRKLSSEEGASLKLLSGIMMLMLGLILILAPQWLNNASTGILLLLTALLVAGLAHYRQKRRQRLL